MAKHEEAAGVVQGCDGFYKKEQDNELSCVLHLGDSVTINIVMQVSVTLRRIRKTLAHG